MTKEEEEKEYGLYTNKAREKDGSTRDRTFTEKLIVDYCFYSSGKNIFRNNRCINEIGYRKFEMEKFDADDIRAAGKVIYAYETDRKSRKSRFVQHLLDLLPEYNRQNEKK